MLCHFRVTRESHSIATRDAGRNDVAGQHRILMMAIAALAGCGEAPAPPKGETVRESTQTAVPAIAKPATDGVATAKPVVAVDLEQSSGAYEFSYGWPAKAAAIPALDALMRKQAAKARAELVKQATEARVEAKADDYPYNPHASDTKWTVVADTPGYLSLLGEIYGYSGGAHGNSGFDSMVWSRSGDQHLESWDFFDMPAAFAASFRQSYCRALDVERAKKRLGFYPGDMFTDCPPAQEQTLILGSSNGRAFDRIGIMIGPYVAGPYAEGSYEVTLPMTTAMLKSVKPAYRSVFAAR